TKEKGGSMEKLLCRLWNGEIVPVREWGKSNEELRHLEELMERNAEKFQKEFGGAQKKCWESYLLCAEEYLSLAVEEAFCTGVCFGARFAAEALFGVEKTE
ncbi:MAG: hypothetical protein IKD11_04840, partial [Oscillospiraceae bacterium]|nr:hypothetical protein [Oscillospiraceae bacterium]